MTVNTEIIAGYWFSVVAIALFAARAWQIYRSEHEQVFRYIAEGTGLISLADLLYGAAHFPANSKLLTGELFGADAALVFGVYFACQFPAHYWSLVTGRRSLIRWAMDGLLLVCALVTLINLMMLIMGTRPLVQLNLDGTIRDGAAAWFNYTKVLLLLLLGVGAGATFLYQGIIDKGKRQRRLGIGILIAGGAGALLTVLNQSVATNVSVGVLGLGVGLIVLGLFTSSSVPTGSTPVG